jgi:hypothetical protein
MILHPAKHYKNGTQTILHQLKAPAKNYNSPINKGVAYANLLLPVKRLWQ